MGGRFDGSNQSNQGEQLHLDLGEQQHELCDAGSGNSIIFTIDGSCQTH